jgi:hypothetical protein
LLLFFRLGFGRRLLFFEPLLLGLLRRLLLLELLLLLDLVRVLLDLDLLRLDFLLLDLGIDVRLALAAVDRLGTIDRLVFGPLVGVAAGVGRLGADVEAEAEVDDLHRNIVRRDEEADLRLEREVSRDALVEADARADEDGRTIGGDTRARVHVALRRIAAVGLVVDRDAVDLAGEAERHLGSAGIAVVPVDGRVLPRIVEGAGRHHVGAARVEEERGGRGDVHAHQDRHLEEERLVRPRAERAVVQAGTNRLHARHDRHVEVAGAEEVDLRVEVEGAAGGEAEADVDALRRAHAHANRRQERGDRRGVPAAGVNRVAVVVGGGRPGLVDRADEIFRAVALHVEPHRRLDLPRPEGSRRAVRLRVDTTRERKGESEPERLGQSIHVARA